jgi:type I restriction enzyme, R subunit
MLPTDKWKPRPMPRSGTVHGRKGLDSLIVAQMTGQSVALSQPVGFGEDPEPFAGLSNWLRGGPDDYDRGRAVDLVQLRAFIAATQPPLVAALDLDGDRPTRQKFLARLQGEIAKRGVIDILRNGLKHGPHDIALFYPSPSPGNPKAAEPFAQNRFSVTRQLRYSEVNVNTLDLALFVNGERSTTSGETLPRRTAIAYAV